MQVSTLCFPAILYSRYFRFHKITYLLNKIWHVKDKVIFIYDTTGLKKYILTSPYPY